MNLQIFLSDTTTELKLPLVEGIKAGFPSPAADYSDLSIDLNRVLIRHPSSTFYARVKGDSMKDASIEEGDLLIIDKSLEPVDGKIAVCYIDGEFTLKRIKLKEDGVFLLPANTNFRPIKVTEENEFIIWGILIHVVKSY